VTSNDVHASLSLLNYEAIVTAVLLW